MDIKTIEAFLVLADHLNFTKSAEQIYISQPAFSRHITRLEDEFGCILFKRDKRKVELTEYGKAFLPFAQNIYSDYAKWNFHLRQIKSYKTGNLNIGFLQDLPHKFFPRAIQTFREQYDSIDLTFRDCTMSDIIEKLLRDDLDLGFSLSHEISDYGAVSFISITPIPMCAAMPKEHPLAEKDFIRMEELAKEPFVMVSPDGYGPGGRHVFYLCKMAGFEPNIVAYASFVPSLLILIKCGVGISIMAQTAKLLAPEGVVLIPLSDNISPIYLQLLWKTNAINPAIPVFVQTCKDLMEEKH